MAVKHLEESKEIQKYGRITLYVRQQERQELLRKVLEYSGANSISNAIFTAIEAYVAEVEKTLANRLQLAQKTKGIWANDPKIEETFEELEQRWEAWRNEALSLKA